MIFVISASNYVSIRSSKGTGGQTYLELYPKRVSSVNRPGRTKSAIIPENITKVHKIVLDDRKLKLRKIADTLKIFEGSVFGAVQAR